jgi:phage terminase large subunit-like protein
MIRSMQGRSIPSAKPLRFIESEFLKIEPLYVTEDLVLKKVNRIGDDEVVCDLLEKFDPDTMDANEYADECCRMKSLLDDRRRDFGILYYKPYNALKIEHSFDGQGRHTAKRVMGGEGKYVETDNYPQENFHKSQKSVRLLLAANKVGKTYSAIAESLQLSFGIHPHRKIKVPNKGRIIGTDLEKGIEEDVWGIFKTMYPPSELSSEPRKYSGGQVKKVNFKCGSSVEFMSYEQDAGLFEGGEGDWVMFNEPPPREVFVACTRWLMKRQGIIFIAATPLWEAWLYDELFLKQGPNPEQPDVFQLCAYENPYLSDEGIRSLVDATPEDEREARIFGAFKHLTGLVYKEFGTVHRIPRFSIPKEWTRYMVMDFHQREACAILWAAVDPKGQLYFYDELKIDKTIFEISEAIKMKEKLEYGRPVPTRWIDSIAATPDRATGKSALKEFRSAGDKLKWPLAFRSSTKDHATGFKAVHEYLQVKNGQPGVYFFEEDVPNAIASMLHYQWDDFKGTKEKTKVSAHSHFADDIRYICIMRPQFSRSLPEGMYEEEIQDTNSTTGYRGG